MILDIFNFRNGISLRPTGYLPSFIDSLVEKDCWTWNSSTAGTGQAAWHNG